MEIHTQNAIPLHLHAELRDLLSAAYLLLLKQNTVQRMRQSHHVTLEHDLYYNVSGQIHFARFGLRLFSEHQTGHVLVIRQQSQQTLLRLSHLHINFIYSMYIFDN